MRDLQMIWAAIVGYFVDTLLTTLVVGSLDALANIDPITIDFTKPTHVLIRLILPALMTVIGGGVAGYIVPRDARPAGALVGGIGIMTLALAFDRSDPHMLHYSIAQCVATLGALVAADLVARRRLRTT